MSVRELVVLGTAGQVPTRDRAHNGCFLRWDDEGILFDPGEGTQRQLTLAGVPASAITRICITHAHGDHCLGLAGVLQRMALDQVEHPVDLYFPAGAAPYVDRLRHASAHHTVLQVREHPVHASGQVVDGPPFAVHARALDHRIETYGWRLEESAGRTMLPGRLSEFGVSGQDVGGLLRSGAIDVDGRRVTLDQVSAPRRGQRFAFVMDTRPCRAAIELAHEADLVVCESTYLDHDAELADRYAHLTAAQAARIAAEAGARRLVLTHFSQRYPDVEAFAGEARPVFAEVVAARDLMRIPIPREPRPRG